MLYRRFHMYVVLNAGHFPREIGTSVVGKRVAITEDADAGKTVRSPYTFRLRGGQRRVFETLHSSFGNEIINVLGIWINYAARFEAQVFRSKGLRMRRFIVSTFVIWNLHLEMTYGGVGLFGIRIWLHCLCAGWFTVCCTYVSEALWFICIFSQW